MAKIKELPDAEYLNSIFRLESDTGELFWKVSFSPVVKVGAVAGTLNKMRGQDSYRSVVINGIHYRVHRIIYKMYYGVEPVGEIDHIDLNKQNNKPSNLRCVSTAENAQNRKKQIDNTSGHKNVYWRPDTKKWRVMITAFGKVYQFGCYLNIEDAVEVAEKERSALHGRFANG